MGLFGLLTGKSDASKAHQQPKIASATVVRIKNILGIQRLESMPAQAARAFQLASDPRAAMGDFVDVIESDEGLSARIIRVANSVYFFRGAPATDIEKAVNNIGLNELRCLISATMLRSLLQGRAKTREQVWANAVAVAICSRSLSRFTSQSEGEAFLCGLLHDVGKLVMIRRAPELYDKVIALISSGDTSFVQAEEQFFETNHAEVGQWVGETWSFPPAVIYAIAHHHDQFPADKKRMGKSTDAAMLVRAADVMAHAAGLGHPMTFRPFQRRAQDELEAAFRQLSISREDGEAIMQEFSRRFEDEFALYQIEK